MKLGFCLPQMGSHVDGHSVREVAIRAEQLGYDTLWVQQRLLRPLKPQIPYPSPDGSFPPQYANVLGPIETLVYAAAITSRIKLGTSVIVHAYHSPVSLAKSVASLDVLSGGRVIFGVGLGWNKDEFDASGTPYRNRGQRLEEYIRCLEAIWGPDPVEFRGRFYQVPWSEIGPKPLQKPRPPMLLGAFAPPAIMRAGRLTDGWIPVAWGPLEGVGQGIQAARQAAQEAGRDPAALQFPLVVIFFAPPGEPLGADRQPFAGSLAQIKEDGKRAEELGVTELIFQTNFLPDVKGKADYLRYLELLRELG